MQSQTLNHSVGAGGILPNVLGGFVPLIVVAACISVCDALGVVRMRRCLLPVLLMVSACSQGPAPVCVRDLADAGCEFYEAVGEECVGDTCAAGWRTVSDVGTCVRKILLCY